MTQRAFILATLLVLLTTSSNYANLHSLKKTIYNIVVNHSPEERLASWFNRHSIKLEEHQDFLGIIQSLITKKEYQNEGVINILLQYSIVQSIDISQCFFLHQAVEHGLYKVAQFLLQNNFDANLLNKKFETPLDRLFYQKEKNFHEQMKMEQLLRTYNGKTSQEAAFMSNILVNREKPPFKEKSYEPDNESDELLKGKTKKEKIGIFYQYFRKKP